MQRAAHALMKGPRGQHFGNKNSNTALIVRPRQLDVNDVLVSVRRDSPRPCTPPKVLHARQLLLEVAGNVLQRDFVPGHLQPILLVVGFPTVV